MGGLFFIPTIYCYVNKYSLINLVKMVFVSFSACHYFRNSIEQITCMNYDMNT